MWCDFCHCFGKLSVSSKDRTATSPIRSAAASAPADCDSPTRTLAGHGSAPLNQVTRLPEAGVESAQLMDSGLCGLSLVAGYYRIAGDPAQLKHQLALTGRSAQAEDIVRGANVLQLKSRILRKVTARRLGAIPYPAITGSPGGWFRRPGRGLRQGTRRGSSIRSAGQRKSCRRRRSRRCPQVRWC